MITVASKSLVSEISVGVDLLPLLNKQPQPTEFIAVVNHESAPAHTTAFVEEYRACVAKSNMLVQQPIACETLLQVESRYAGFVEKAVLQVNPSTRPAGKVFTTNALPAEIAILVGTPNVSENLRITVIADTLSVQFPLLTNKVAPIQEIVLHVDRQGESLLGPTPLNPLPASSSFYWG